MIGLIGNYGHNNLGDEAILLTLLQQLGEWGYGSEQIRIFTDNVQDTKQRYPVYQCLPMFHVQSSRMRTLIHNLPRLWSRFDRSWILVLGGGGLFVDSYVRALLAFALIATVVKIRGGRVVCYQIGVGPLDTTLGRLLARLLSLCAGHISVRDQAS